MSLTKENCRATMSQDEKGRRRCMKRIQWEQILALLTTAALTIAFAGCGTSSTPTEESAETTSTADQELSLLDTYVSNTVISTGSNTVWFSVLIIGALIVVIAPFIIYASKKPGWVDPNSTFEPFHWEEQPAAQVAGKTATVTAGTSASATASESVAPASTGNAPSANGGNGSKAPNTPPKG